MSPHRLPAARPDAARASRPLRGLSLAAVGALALSACGGVQDGVTEIDFYYPIAVGGPLESVMDGYIEDFNAEHDDIEVTPVYSGDYEQTLASVQSAAQAGSTLAVTVLLSTDVRSLEDSGLIAPIGEIVDDREWFDTFDEGFMANSTLDDGTVASIPFQRSTIVMYWNQELFEEAGLDPEAAPETWDEMAEAGQQVQDSTEASWGCRFPPALGSSRPWPSRTMSCSTTRAAPKSTSTIPGPSPPWRTGPSCRRTASTPAAMWTGARPHRLRQRGHCGAMAHHRLADPDQ